MKRKIIKRSTSRILSSLKRGVLGEEIKIIGVTGTLGKTTVAHMLWYILVQNGIKAGLISSDGVFKLDDKDFSYRANDLDQGRLIDLIENFIEESYEVLVVEVSSKALANGVFDRIRFDSGIITNMKHHDKDLYSTWEEYAELKLSFLNLMKDDALLLVDSSNEILDWLEKNERNIFSNILLYIAGETQNKVDENKFVLDSKTYSLNSYSEVNIKNAIQAIKMAQNYIQNKDHFVEELSSFQFPKGRMELIRSNQVNVIIDGAKRKEEVDSSLVEIKKRLTPDQQIIAVVGAEGSIDPDRKKVGLAAVHVADKVILAPTDPRKEDVEYINSVMIAYMEKDGGVVVERFTSQEEFRMANKESLKIRIQRVVKNGSVPIISFDENNYTARIDAIEMSLILANPGDLVYICGKGNDNSMFFDGIEYEWSDHEALQIAMDRLGII